MYRVYFNRKVKSFTLFPDYELARQWVRKQLRKMGAAITPDGSNPVMEGSGFEIRRID